MEAKFYRILRVVGKFYRARSEDEGRRLILRIGPTHEVEFTVPPAVRAFCFKKTPELNLICCTGIDKQRVNQFAAAVRDYKRPECWRGTGILYQEEKIKLKLMKKDLFKQ